MQLENTKTAQMAYKKGLIIYPEICQYTGKRYYRLAIPKWAEQNGKKYLSSFTTILGAYSLNAINRFLKAAA